MTCMAMVSFLPERGGTAADKSVPSTIADVSVRPSGALAKSAGSRPYGAPPRASPCLRRLTTCQRPVLGLRSSEQLTQMGPYSQTWNSAYHITCVHGRSEQDRPVEIVQS